MMCASSRRLPGLFPVLLALIALWAATLGSVVEGATTTELANSGRALMQLTAGSVSKPQATAALANLVAYTEYFPKMTYPTEMVEVSCGGLEKFVSGGSVLQGLSVRTDTGTLGVSGVMCYFPDQTQKLLGTWNWFELNERRANSNVTILQENEFDYPVNWAGTRITRLKLYTSRLETSRLCDISLNTADGQGTSNDRFPTGPLFQFQCDRGQGNRQETMVPQATNSLLVDVKAMVTAKEGKLYAVSFGFLKLEGIKVNAVTYERLNTQPGPLPAYNLGLLWDNTGSQIAGDMSTTFSYTTTRKAVVGASNSVGKAVEQAFKIGSPVPIPEFGLEEKWDSTSIITELRETTAETQIDITPKLSVNGSDYATLVNVMYNGSAQLPFVADATVTDNSGKTAEIRFPGSLRLDGSLTFSATGGHNKPLLTREERLLLRDKTPWRPVVHQPTPGYPYSLPLVYSAPYVDAHTGPKPNYQADASNVCGDMMSKGGVRRIKASWTDWDHLFGMITGIRLYAADGTEFCTNFGSMTVPDGQPQRSGEWTLAAGEVITGVRALTGGLNAGHVTRIAKLELRTNKRQWITIGENNVLPPYPDARPSVVEYVWSYFSLGSGVLDGFVFNLNQETYGSLQIRNLIGVAPIFLQPYRNINLELGDLQQAPVDAPSIAQTLNLQKLSSTNIKVQWTSKTQYDIGSEIKNSWSFAAGVKVDKLPIPRVPITISAEKKWINSRANQKSDTSSWSMTTKMAVELNLVWSSQIPDDATVVGVLKVYDRPVQLPYYGNISMEFGSGYTMKWPITGTMTAQDGRYAIFQTTTKRPTKRRQSGAGAASSTAASDASSSTCGGWNVQELLQLPVSHPARHKALGWYTVNRQDDTWTAVADMFVMDETLLVQLNPQMVTGDQLPDIASMVGQRVLVCTA